MRKTYLLILIGLFLSITHAEAKKVNGTIFFEKDTLDVIFKIPTGLLAIEPNYLALQKKVKYFNEEGEVKVLRPTDAKEIRFMFRGERIRMLSRPNNNNVEGILIRLAPSKDIFLKVRELQVGGKVKLFDLYIMESSSYGGANGMGGTHTVRKDVFQKKGEELYRSRGLFFRNDMMNYFSDCPELVKKIKKREFGRRDVKMIAEFYNEMCK